MPAQIRYCMPLPQVISQGKTPAASLPHQVLISRSEPYIIILPRSSLVCGHWLFGGLLSVPRFIWQREDLQLSYPRVAETAYSEESKGEEKEK